ncbi:MAG TPA: c-type cytochrome domain-containing protein, partial [Verrucomicrobiae bacterium]
MKSKVQGPKSKAGSASCHHWRLWTLDFGLWTMVFFTIQLAAADIDLSKLPPADTRKIDFAADIKPIFEASCFRCHGTEKPKGRFSLATREAALKGGDEGIDIIPGDSAKSPLIHFVARLVPEMEMPPPDKGDPLTRAQIALLRAWIDQGVAWEQIDLSSQFEPQFSFTPAVRYVTVSGNARKFEEHQWVRRGFSGGASDFRVAEKRKDGTSSVIEGRALTDDYKVTLDIRKEDAGFVRTGFEQFRRYYDDRGPYYQFRPSGFATATPGDFGLHRDLHLDIASAFIEFGLTLPKWPSVVLGYELHTRHGDESTEQWGPVTYGRLGGSFNKHIYPAFQHNDQDVHVLRLDVAYDIAGVRIEDNVRVEFSDLDNQRTSALLFPAGAASPAAFAITRETHDEVQFANTLHGEKSVRDWLFVSAGYLFTRFDADATLGQEVADGSGQPVGTTMRGGAPDIVLKETAQVLNANALFGPWDGFTAVAGVLNEWSDHQGIGQQNLADTDPDDPTGGVPRERAFVSSTIDRLIVEENILLRYAAIPATVLFAEARLRQERTAKFEELDSKGSNSLNSLHTQFLRETDEEIDGQEYKTGFAISPWRRLSFNASYTHRQHDADYDHERDKFGDSVGNTNAGYPAFIRSRETGSDSFETRLAVRPASWLKTTLSYRLALTDYDATTDAGPTPKSTTAAGRVFAGEHDSATYSLNISVTPARRWYFSTTLSYQESRTWTEDHGNPSVVPYRGDIWNVAASSTFALSTRTDLTGSYSFSRARFGQHNFADGLPLGIDYDLHSAQVGVSHRVNTHLTTSVQYGFFQY